MDVCKADHKGVSTQRRSVLQTGTNLKECERKKRKFVAPNIQKCDSRQYYLRFEGLV